MLMPNPLRAWLMLVVPLLVLPAPATNSGISAKAYTMAGNGLDLQASAACDCPQIKPAATSEHPLYGKVARLVVPFQYEISANWLEGPRISMGGSPHRVTPLAMDYPQLHASLSNRDMQYDGDWDRGDLAMAHDFDADGKIGIWNKPRPPIVEEADKVVFAEGGTSSKILRNGLVTFGPHTQRNDVAYNGDTIEDGLLANIARANKYGEVSGDLRENSLRISWFLAGDLVRAQYAMLTEMEKAGLRKQLLFHPPSYPNNGFPGAGAAPPVVVAPMQNAAMPAAAKPVAAKPVAQAPQPMPAAPARQLFPQIQPQPLNAPPHPNFNITKPQPHLLQSNAELAAATQRLKAGGTIAVGVATSRAEGAAKLGGEARRALSNALLDAYAAYQNLPAVAPAPGELLLDPFDMTNAALDVIAFAPAQERNNFFDYRWTEPWRKIDDDAERPVGYDRDLVPRLITLASMSTRFGGHAAKGSRADAIACKAFAILVQLAAQGAPDSSHFRFYIGRLLNGSVPLVDDSKWHGPSPFTRAARGALMVAGFADADEAHRVFVGLQSYLDSQGNAAQYGTSKTAMAQLQALDVTVHDLSAYAVGQGRADFDREARTWIGDYMTDLDKGDTYARGKKFLTAEVDAWHATSAEADPGVTLVRRPIMVAANTAPPAACPFKSCADNIDSEIPNYPDITFPTHPAVTMTAEDGSAFIARDQPIKIDVILPKDMATSANPQITVTDKRTGSSAVIPLGLVTSNGELVSYSTDVAAALAKAGKRVTPTGPATANKPATLADPGSFSYLPHTFRSKDGDPISATIAGVSAEAMVYDNQDLADLARAKDTLQSTLKAFDLIEKDTSRPAAERVVRQFNVAGVQGGPPSGWLERKRGAIHNALLILNQKNGPLAGTNYSLNDTMKARIGEIYVQFMETDANQWDLGDHSQCGRPNSAEARRAHTGADNRFPGVNFETCPEAMNVNTAVYSVGEKQNEAAFRNLANITIAFYHTYVEAGCNIQQLFAPKFPCASQFWMLFSGTDELGKEADATTQVINAAGMALPFIVNGGNAGLKQELEALANSETTLVEDAAKAKSAATASEIQAEKETQAALAKAAQQTHAPVPSAAELEAVEVEARRSEEILSKPVAELSHLDGNVAGKNISVPANIHPSIDGAEVFVPKLNSKLPNGVNPDGSYLKQIGDNTCLLTVWENIRRMLGKVPRTEEQNVGMALGLGKVARLQKGLSKDFFIYHPLGGADSKNVEYFMESEGILARWVPEMNLADIRDALKRGWMTSVSIWRGTDPKTGVDVFHQIQVFGIFKDPKTPGVAKVLYGDPGNGRYWLVDACEFVQAMTSSSKGTRFPRGMFYKLP